MKEYTKPQIRIVKVDAAALLQDSLNNSKGNCLQLGKSQNDTDWED